MIVKTSSLQSHLSKSPYQAYVYSYPHKTAYRPLTPSIYLADLWQTQAKEALFLYIHIPFCEMRCGFCNLFTTVSHNQDFMSLYVQTVQRQAERMKAVLGDASFVRFAIGGGTPTHLPIEYLESILNIAEYTMGANLQAIPISVEVSPETATLEKLNLLRSRGVDRISIGVQSFIDTEVLATQRRHSTTQVEATLSRIKEIGFTTLNIDLIYGLPGQTVITWLQSVQAALCFQPEEIYMYPLYVRPLTSLGRTDREWDDIRLACYREGRDLLLSAGYQQVSMRMFQKGEGSYLSPSSPVYCCQADGMVGLGCGARSYTTTLHYSNEYAVGSKGISDILQRYTQTEDKSFDYADYGFKLDIAEQQRRYILLSLLSEQGLNMTTYRQQFQSDIYRDFPELSEMLDFNLATQDEHIIQLTAFGLERSDTIGAWLFSQQVQILMQEYELK